MHKIIKRYSGRQQASLILTTRYIDDFYSIVTELKSFLKCFIALLLNVSLQSKQQKTGVFLIHLEFEHQLRSTSLLINVRKHEIQELPARSG